MEEVSIFAHVLNRPVILERREFFEFVAPNVLLEHDILVLTDLLHLSQNSRIL